MVCRSVVSLFCMWMSFIFPSFISFSSILSFFLTKIDWPPVFLVMIEIFQWLCLTWDILKFYLLSNWPKAFWILFRCMWYCIKIYIRLLYRMVYVVIFLFNNLSIINTDYHTVGAKSVFYFGKQIVVSVSLINEVSSAGLCIRYPDNALTWRNTVYKHRKEHWLWNA